MTYATIWDVRISITNLSKTLIECLFRHQQRDTCIQKGHLTSGIFLYKVAHLDSDRCIYYCPIPIPIPINVAIIYNKKYHLNNTHNNTAYIYIYIILHSHFLFSVFAIHMHYLNFYVYNKFFVHYNVFSNV
eukprot:425646_1